MANAEDIFREEDELLEDFDLVNDVEETEDADNEHKLTKEEVDEYMRYLDN